MKRKSRTNVSNVLVVGTGGAGLRAAIAAHQAGCGGSKPAQVRAPPADRRNDPARFILLTRQWLRAGRPLGSRLRTQFAQWAAWGHGEDDLTRLRVGGMNPYVVPVAGAPWAAYLSEQLLAVSWSGHFRVRGETEVGAVADAVLLADRRRTGHSESGWLGGIGVLFDGRSDHAQFDAHAGWSPGARWEADSGQFSLFLSAGYLCE